MNFTKINTVFTLSVMCLFGASNVLADSREIPSSPHKGDESAVSPGTDIYNRTRPDNNQSTDGTDIKGKFGGDREPSSTTAGEKSTIQQDAQKGTGRSGTRSESAGQSGYGSQGGSSAGTTGGTYTTGR